MYAEVAHLIGVGLPGTALLGHRNAHVADSTAVAFELARALVGTTVDNERTSFELRSLRTGGEMWEPAVVLIGATATFRTVEDLPAGGHGIGLVAPAAPGELPDAPTGWSGRPTSWRLVGFGSAIELTPVGLSNDDLVAIDTVLPTPTASCSRSNSTPCDGLTMPMRSAHRRTWTPIPVTPWSSSSR